MIKKRNTRMRFSLKLFICFTPLIIVPFCLVAVLAYKVSAGTVTSVSRDKLLAEAEGSADSIETIFRMCEKDLEILWQFFFEQTFDTSDAENYGVNLQKLIPALQKFRNSSPMYLQVGFWNVSGNRVISSDAGVIAPDYLALEERRLILDSDNTTGNGFPYYRSPVSPVFYSDRLRGYVVTVHKAFYDDYGSLLGSLMIDLDYGQMVALISSAPKDADDQGFAFLVDRNGETIFHPDYEPYSTRFTQYRDPVMREFIIYTTLGHSGFKVYKPVNSSIENMAAYAPIQTSGWTLVKTVPLSKFTQSASALRTYIIQIGFVILIIAVLVLYFLANQLNKPVLRLTRVTRQMAAGDLNVPALKISGTYETAELTKDFNVMARNLKRIQAELVASEKMISLGRLSAGVAHELRNPLNAIKLTILYMERHRLHKESFFEAADMVYSEIDRLNKFVNNVLYYAKETPPVKTPCDITAVINKVLDLNRQQAELCGVKTVVETADLPQIKADEYQLMQVLLNLYNNALQAMPKGGVLTVKIAKHMNESGILGISILFMDTGDGIKKDALANIFDPFFSTKKGGTGLGLAISRSIIEAHGGFITASNNTNANGAAITVFIPLA